MKLYYASNIQSFINNRLDKSSIHINSCFNNLPFLIPTNPTNLLIIFHSPLRSPIPLQFHNCPISCNQHTRHRCFHRCCHFRNDFPKNILRDFCFRGIMPSKRIGCAHCCPRDVVCYVFEEGWAIGTFKVCEFCANVFFGERHYKVIDGVMRLRFDGCTYILV